MEKYQLLSKIAGILDADDYNQNLMVSIYQLELKKLIYFNAAFEDMLGDKIKALQSQGWDFWFNNSCPDVCASIKRRINIFLSTSLHQKPLRLQYQLYDRAENKRSVSHEMVLYNNNGTMLLINYLFDVSEKVLVEKCLKDKNSNGYANPNRMNPISPREEEVLILIADGYSSKQIADQLFISNHTVISHRKHLIEKFQVKNTAQLIKKASRVIEL